MSYAMLFLAVYAKLLEGTPTKLETPVHGAQSLGEGAAFESRFGGSRARGYDAPVLQPVGPVRVAIWGPGRDGDECPQRGPAEIRTRPQGQHDWLGHRQRWLRGDAAAGLGHERARGAARRRRDVW